ncbi:MAG: hypothetical protein LQ344_006889 [Seirophora lacunosa]|nr:MAG: hypothetical protein LQ344_006889 [Seirophora lacunosa]
MYTAILATALTGFAVVDAATGQLGDAAIVQGNPVGVTYTATLPNSLTTGIRGYVAGTSNANGTGVNFNVNLFGFPDSSLGPFCPSSFFGNRSIVIHTSNTTRLTCANFTLTSGNSTGSNTTSSSGNGTITGSNPVPAPFTGGAAATYVGTGAIIAGLAAFFL